MENVFDTLKERGFIRQCTHENEVKQLLSEPAVFYIGFDPTADSLTIGHYLTIIAMTHMQRAGHKPIALMGGGTGMVGDPTGKTEMRRVMGREEIQYNVDCFKEQMARFIDFNEGKAILIDNSEWLLNLQYIPFIREYGVYFSVNRMLAAEAYRSRLEQGLTFFEFNYMLMQSYDFLELYRRYGCRLQIGGDDQWSNIIAGAELVRKAENTPAFGMTFTLLETSQGDKMGKTQQGALWMDGSKTPPYELFQYFRNVDDADVPAMLRLLTFLPMDEIKTLSALEGSGINQAKEKLAFEVTRDIHCEKAAQEALKAARSLFGGEGGEGSVPQTDLTRAALNKSLSLTALLEMTGLAPSRSEARRIIQQGGARINDKKIDSVDYIITEKDFTDGALMLKKGKKAFHRVRLV